MLFLGIYLINQFFAETEEIRTTIEDATEDELESLLSHGEVVSLPTNKRNIRQGESALFSLSVLNNLGSRTDFTVDIDFKKAYDAENIELTPSDANSWVYYIDSFTLDNNQAKKLSILVEIPKGTPEGTYIFDVTAAPHSKTRKMYVVVI